MSLDGRHKWDGGVRDGARVTHTCRACGRVETYELIVPDAFLDALISSLSAPNPYRSMFR